MLIRRRYHHPVGRDFVRFTIVVTSALVAVFALYFHSSFIDAFSLGIKNQPPAQLSKQRVSRPSSPISSSNLVLKVAFSDEDLNVNGESSSPFFANSDEAEEIDDDDSPFPFFANTENEFQLDGEVPFLEGWVGVYDTYKNLKRPAKKEKDLSSPFFASKEDQSEISQDRKELDTIGSDLSSPFFAEKEDQLQIDEEPVIFKSESNEDSDKMKTPVMNKERPLDLPFFASNERIARQFQKTKDSLQERAKSNAWIPESVKEKVKMEGLKDLVESSKVSRNPISIDKTVTTVVGAIKDLPSKIENVKVNPEKIVSNVQDVGLKMNKSIQATKQVVEKTVEKTQETVKDVEVITKKVQQSLGDTKQLVDGKIEKTQAFSNKVKQNIEVKTDNVKRSLQVTNNKVKERLEVTNSKLKESFEVSNSKMKQELEATNKKVKQSLEVTNKEVQQKLEVTNSKLKKSLKVTEQIVGEQLEKTQETIEVMKALSKKIAESKAAADAKAKAKVFLQQEAPDTLTEEVFDLAGKASIAAAKLVLWTTKKAGSLALKKSQSIYDDKIRPEVEAAWNAQVESANSSVEKVKGVLNDQVESLNNSFQQTRQTIENSVEEAKLSAKTSVQEVKQTIQTSVRDNTQSMISSVEEAKQNVKNAPSKVKLSVAESFNKVKTVKQPAFVSRKDVKSDSKGDLLAQEFSSKENVPISTEKIISKSPKVLSKELDEAELLAKEIADALETAERALSEDSSTELNEPMIEIENVNPIKSVDTEVPPPKSEREKKGRRKIGMYKYLTRFKTNAFQSDTPAFESAKTQDDLDAELEKALSLAKEISAALDSAERNMNTTSHNIKSMEKQIDEWTENTTI